MIEPQRPYHRWPSNEDADRHPHADRCLVCGVHRFPLNEVEWDLPNLACPGHRIRAVRREDVDVCQVCDGKVVVEAGGDYWRHVVVQEQPAR